MTKNQSTANDGEQPNKGDILPDEECDPDPDDDGEIAALGRALITAILEYSPIGVVQELLDEDMPLWYQDEDGWSALHAAASVGDAELVKGLLQRGALWNSGEARSHPLFPRV
jgi:type IV protein arginine methyltransferase